MECHLSTPPSSCSRLDNCGANELFVLAKVASSVVKKKRRNAKRNDRPLPRKEASLDAAIRLHKRGRLLEAERAYRAVLRVNPRDPQALYLCGVVTGELERPHEAIDLLRRAVSLDPQHLPALSQLAKLSQEVGQLAVSAGALRELISLRPDLGELYSNLGLVLRRMGIHEEAAGACRRAAE